MSIAGAMLGAIALLQGCRGSQGVEDRSAHGAPRGCTAALEWQGGTYHQQPLQPNAVRASGRLNNGALRGCPKVPGNSSRRQGAKVLRIKSVKPTVAVLVNGTPGLFVRAGYLCRGGSRYFSWRPLACHPRGVKSG